MLTENRNTALTCEYTDDIINTIIAFANTAGGTIYIGVQNNGTVTGIEHKDQVLLKISNTLHEIRPDATLCTECAAKIVADKTVIIVTVRCGTARPYYIGSKGLCPEGVFIRQGACTLPATETTILNMIRETAILNMIREKSFDHYEDSPSQLQKLTFKKVSSFLEKRNIILGESQKKILGFIGHDGIYTNLALLLSEQCMHTIKIAVFDGCFKAVFKDRIELTGSVLTQLEEAYQYMDRYNHTRMEYIGLDRMEKRDYPPETIREALINAIIHRDYTYSDSTLISIFDDRIEFVTIGGFLRGLTQNDIMLGISALRNIKLANIFYRLNLIEAYGTGIQKIIHNYLSHPVSPKIEGSDHTFRITLPNRNTISVEEGEKHTKKTVVTPREEAVMVLLNKRKFIVRKDVQETLDISQATAILLLREMTEKGLLIKEGSGNLIKYHIGK